MTDKHFNIRVYGLCIDQGQILISREWLKGFEMTKFPGGGLKWGEGVLDTLNREFKEETGIQVVTQQHFYTTEEFVPSRFNPNDQLISIYYLVKLAERPKARSFWEKRYEKRLTLAWFNYDSFNHLNFTFPVDQAIQKLLLDNPKLFL